VAAWTPYGGGAYPSGQRVLLSRVPLLQPVLVRPERLLLGLLQRIPVRIPVPDAAPAIRGAAARAGGRGQGASERPGRCRSLPPVHAPAVTREPVPRVPGAILSTRLCV